jgi:hypothetical protein
MLETPIPTKKAIGFHAKTDAPAKLAKSGKLQRK